MFIRKNCFVFTLLFVWNDSVHADDEAGFYWSGKITENTPSFYKLGFEYDKIPPVCHANNTITGEVDDLETVAINFHPKNRRSILGISLCTDGTREDCYVIQISGVVSRRIGYFWRKHSRNETGDELWVPGNQDKLPSTLIRNDVTARKASWDPEGKTKYQFYLEFRRDKRVTIRLNGGIAKQQKEMDFEIPSNMYRKFTVASHSNDSLVNVEGAIGCSPFKRVQFERGQELSIYWEKPEGSLGVSFCTDSGQSECYVLEIVGALGLDLKFYWRKHSIFEESGEEAWVPGDDMKVYGTVLDEGSKKSFDKPWESEKPVIIELLWTSNDKLHVMRSEEDKKNKKEKYYDLDLPSDFRYTTIGTLVHVEGKEENKADFVLYGPCFNGKEFGFMSQECKQNILPKDPSFPNYPHFDVFSLKPGVAEADLVSEVLESKAPRKNLCLSLVGLAGHKGGSVTATVMDASGASNTTDFYPPKWQRVRMSVELPTPLQKVPLKVNLRVERPTAESFVLLHEAKLCSYDGCGMPTGDATPFIALGKKTMPAKYPWHVAIFQKKNDTHFVYICGGTLIRSDAVISAAHCFFGEDEKKQDESLFKLAVGKKYSSLYVFEPYQQLSDANEIHIEPRYKGKINNYVHDIAVIQVEFTISPQVLPACFDWYGTNVSHLQPGDVGEVAGWGLHEADIQSQELHFAELPYVTYDDCIKGVPESFWVYISQDKFCAGNINGSTVKKGDSGGGLVFKKGGLWYLEGVVSLGVHQQLTYSTFTDVSQFTPWIKKALRPHISRKVLLSLIG